MAIGGKARVGNILIDSEQDKIIVGSIELQAIPSDGIKTSHIADEQVTAAKIAKSFGTETTVSVDAGSTSTISKGIYLVSLGANTSVEYSPDGGTTWRTLIPAGQGGVVISDGSNVRLNNAGTAAEDSYLLPLA